MPKKEKKGAPVKIKGNKNHKAFNVANVVRTKRTQQRNLDRAQKKELIPLINRDEELPPPALVVVMGPKGVGKSTLIRSLAKIYTGQNLSDTVGPITVVAGRKRRVTFFECPLDILSMTDLSKTADLVLLMIDASYGFEMETFEFLNQLQLHGFPKVMGILTHLDKFKANKSLQSTKKALKHRFWTEIYKGAKVFEFMGVVNNKYRKHEVKRLSLYISRIKFRPLIWRNTHPYVVADRVEDVTTVARINEEGAMCDRDVTLYGYVRGSHLKPSMKIHLIGAGDFEIASISALPDPCPLPGGKGDKNTVSLKSKKDNLLYAPLANIGRVSMDKDGLYIEIKNVHYTKKEHLHLSDMQQGIEHHNHMQPIDSSGRDSQRVGSNSDATPLELLRSMQDVTSGVDTQLRKSSQMSLFANSSSSHRVTELNSDVEDEEQDEYDNQDDFDGDDNHSDYDSAEEEDEDNSDVASNDSDNDEEVEEEEEEDGSDYSYDEEAEEDDDRQHNNNNQQTGVNDIRKTALSSVLSHSQQSTSLQSQQGKYFSKLPSLMESTSTAITPVGLTPRVASLLAKDDAVDTDWMRAVYGANWAQSAGIATPSEDDSRSTKKSNTAAAVQDDEDDEDLFSFKKHDVNAMSAAEKLYKGFNAQDSSRANYASMLGGSMREVEQQIAQLQLKGGSVSGDDASEHSDSDESATMSTPQTQRAEDRHHHSAWLQGIKLRFVTGGAWTNRGAAATEGEEDGEGDVFGDLEDLQTGQMLTTSGSKGKKGIGKKSSKDDSSDDDEEEMERKNIEIDKQLRLMNASKKADFKAKFDKSYDSKKGGNKDGSDDEGKTGGLDGDEEDDEEKKVVNEDEELVDMTAEEKKYLEAARRAQEELRERNRREFGEEGELARQQHEGFRQGLYVRILLRRVAYEFTANFRAQLPVVLGGLLPHETAMGFINARVKRHRWHKRILKSNDPLIFSIGWRRFQSIPVYTLEDPNERERYLKYTPEHMHCTATFYGPLVPPNTGILAFQKTTNDVAGFRISLTGTTLEQRATPVVVKKLKLVGTPTKVYKNTAFISGMFNSALEVAKFEHAKLKTVSGIRGSIKKAMREGGAPGTFRASFEDKILMSDIVICRLWVPVEIKKFYNPVLSLLAPLVTNGNKLQITERTHDDTMNVTAANSNDATVDSLESNASGNGLSLMRTTRDIRVAEQIKQEINKDSLYKPIVRKPRDFKKLRVPAKLQEALPFKSKPKMEKPLNRQSYAARRAVILEPEERKSRAALQMLSTIRKDKVEKRQVSNDARQANKAKDKERESSRFEDFHKETKKRKYMEQGKEKLMREKKAAKRG